MGERLLEQGDGADTIAEQVGETRYRMNAANASLSEHRVFIIHSIRRGAPIFGET